MWGYERAVLMSGLMRRRVVICEGGGGGGVGLFFFFNDTATTEIYTLSLHDALPILVVVDEVVSAGPGWMVIHEDDGAGGIGGVVGFSQVVEEIGRAHV